MPSTPIITLRNGREDAVKRFHPWLFSGAIAHINGSPEVGDLVTIKAYNNETLGVGYYEGGNIAIRMLHFGATPMDRIEDLLRERIVQAYKMREALQLTPAPHVTTEEAYNNVYRLIHGEGDDLPGLVVDVYGNTAVLQAHTLSMFRWRHTIAQILIEVLAPHVTAIYDKSASTLSLLEEPFVGDGFLIGHNEASAVKENGIQFFPDWEHGQKTGFFIDQRDNRKLMGAMSGGRRVLNMFCYSGGFSLYALQGGADEVVSVDSSARALNLVDRNVMLNHHNTIANGRHESVTADAFEYLKELPKNAFDLIVLDPPAFAKKRAAVKNALNGYRKLNALALDRIEQGGFLFTYSCSQAVSPTEFRLTVLTAAVQVGRRVRILRQMQQAADHPINLFHPEGEYLKGLLLYVE